METKRLAQREFNRLDLLARNGDAFNGSAEDFAGLTFSKRGNQKCGTKTIEHEGRLNNVFVFGVLRPFNCLEDRIHLREVLLCRGDCRRLHRNDVKAQFVPGCIDVARATQRGGMFAKRSRL